MIAFLLTFLIAQGIPALSGQTGTVAGVLRTAAGEPAAGVRVSAMVPPESNVDVRSAAALAALTETDSEGRFRLDGVPQGRYYVVAGRVDQPTFYPGTTEMAKARILSVAPGSDISGIDFAVLDSSVRTNPSSSDIAGQLGAYLLQLATQLATPPRLVVPMQVVVEDGAKMPVFTTAGFTKLRLTEVAGGVEATTPLNNPSINLAIVNGRAAPAYRVSVDNLPEGYFVKSMTFGADSVMTAPLKIPSANMPRTVVSTIAGVTQQIVTQVSATGVAMPTLTITLSMMPLPTVAGVRVSGRAKDVGPRSIYLSGNPGTLYADGTFEFRGVLPGRHLAAAFGNLPSQASLAAVIVVGDRDVEGVQLQETAVLPMDMKVPTPPGPAGGHAPGQVLALASLRGRALEEGSGQPIEEGYITLEGREAVTAPIGTGGQYEFPKLLPGTYNVEMKIFGHSNVRQTVDVGEEDVVLNLTTLKFY